MKICFVVLNYNVFLETKALVSALQDWDQEKLKYHIVVVDNCSKDDSFDQLKKQFFDSPVVDVIRSEKNGGYSYGNNFGAKFCIKKYNPEFIAIANPDIQVDQETIIRLLETFDVDERIAMTAPIMKNLSGDFSIYSQRLPEYSDDLRACWTEKKPPSLSYGDLKTLPGHEECILTEMLPGSFFVIRAEAFQKIGMLDEGTFLFCEERIIGRKLKEKAYKLVLRRDLFFVHAHSVSIKREMDTIRTWRILWNSRIYYQTVYNHITSFQSHFLKICAWLFLKKLRIIMMLNKMK